MERIQSTPAEDAYALKFIITELEFYDNHPTEVDEIFIPQAFLRRLVQLVQDNQLIK